jgi:L-ascorbate oxidase
MDVGDQSGTFIYHAHTGLDQNWAMGSLIVEDSPSIATADASRYSYDDEKTFLLSQCWHTPMSQIAAGILGSPFEDIPETDSLLINGQSYGEWQEGTNGNSTGYDVITVKPNATYRFRVIALGMDSMLTFRIANHSRLRIIEMDSILTDPVETDHLQLNVAQRYSVLVTMDQPIGNYWIETEMIPGPGPTNGRAILHYAGAPYPDSMRTQIFPDRTNEVELDEWVLSELHPSSSLNQSIVYPVPHTVDKEFVITSKQVNVNGGTKFSINGDIFRDYYPPLLHQIRHGLNFSAKRDPHVYEILVGESVQIVFVNTMSDDGECEQHPWHFHGHAFHVVGQGPDGYNSKEASALIEENVAKNLNQFRDVVTLLPNQTREGNSSGTPCGWVAVRFVANNPGVWIVHCHLTAHMLMGKLFILYEHTDQDPRLAMTY